MLTPQVINGMRIYACPHMTESGNPYKVKRTWKERLFTFNPWKPFKTHNTIVPQVPSRQVYQKDDSLYMHPEMIKELENSMVERYGSFNKPLDICGGSYRMPTIT